METVPVPSTVMVVPEMVAGPETTESVTGNPELAVALIVNGATPSATLHNAPNVILCEAAVTLTDPSRVNA